MMRDHEQDHEQDRQEHEHGHPHRRHGDAGPEVRGTRTRERGGRGGRGRGARRADGWVGWAGWSGREDPVEGFGDEDGPQPGRGGHGHPGNRGSGRGRSGRGPGRRARRGDVRAALLALLTERPMHGYEMIQELEERTGGVWRPSPGAVYPALQLLDDQGLVTADETEGKRRYRLTEAGRARAAEHEGRAPWDAVTRGIDPVQVRLRDAVAQIGVATRQVAEAGTEAQQAAAAEILAQTRRRLYALLAEEPDPSGDEQAG